MKKSVLSVFVDESGKFQYPDPHSRFYIVGMVFHDQGQDATELISKLDSDWIKMGLANFCFHAGPLKLAESKLTNGEQLSYDETRIFRGPRIFKHDILRVIKRKEI